MFFGQSNIESLKFINKNVMDREKWSNKKYDFFKNGNS